MNKVDVRAFAMPERYRLPGRTEAQVPVVVMLDQGGDLVGRDRETEGPKRKEAGRFH